LSAPQLVIDFVMAGAVGVLSMFVLLLASFQSFDAVSFEAALRYETRLAADEKPRPSEDSLDLTVTEGALVMSERRFDDVARWRGDFSDSVAPVVWSHEESSGQAVHDIFAANLVSGTADTTGVLLDQSNAAALGVVPGDGLVLKTWDDDICRLELSGITRSYNEVGYTAPGLLVVPADACDEGVTTWTDFQEHYLQFNGDADAAGAQNWSERVGEVLLNALAFRVSGLLPAILLIGLGLWCIASLRATRRIRDRLELPSEILFDLGCTAARVRSTHLLVSGVLVTAAALGAAWGAHEALWRIAGFFTQSAHWVTVALVFAAATMTVLLVAHFRASREASRRPAAPTRPPVASKETA
jgi:hypothetical protein